MAGNTPKNPEYGRVIKERRKEKGDTQQELAKKMGVRRGTVANWEKGVMPAYLPDLVKYLSEVPKHREADRSIQLLLPFESPINFEVRILPQRADTVQFEVQRKDKAG